MAFCTQCGANVAGAFCNQCGARASQPAAGGPVAAPAGFPSPAAAPVPPAGAPVPAVPVKRGLSPVVWVLIVIGGLFALGAVAVVGTGAFIFHKARQAGIDPELWRTNPGMAVGKMMAAFNPDLDVVRTNESEGTVTLRDRRTGKQFSIGIDAARSGSFRLKAEEDGKTATVEFGGNVKAPSWVPQYPGSKPQAVFSAKGQTDNEGGEAGSFTFTTSDSRSKVAEFYEGKAREMGLELQAGMIGVVIAGDDQKGQFLKVVAVGDSNDTLVTVTYGRKR